jgi:hypothetical protein
MDRCMADQCGDSISIRPGVCGGLMSLELTVTDGIIMVGLGLADDQTLSCQRHSTAVCSRPEHRNTVKGS